MARLGQVAAMKLGKERQFLLYLLSERNGSAGDSDPAFDEGNTSLKHEPGASAPGFRWDRILGISP